MTTQFKIKKTLTNFGDENVLMQLHHLLVLVPCRAVYSICSKIFWVSAVCLDLFSKQLVFKVLEHLNVSDKMFAFTL